MGNVHWLSRRFRTLLESLTGLPVEQRFRLNAEDNGREVIRQWYSLLDEPMSMQGWAHSFWRIPPPPLIEAMAADYRDSLVVSIEMSPLLQGVFDALNVPWIDVGISPRRFLRDLAISLKTSSHFRLDAAPELLLQPAEIASAVQRVRAAYSGKLPNLDGTAVFFAQTNADRTLIHEGRIFNCDDIVQAVGPALDGRRLLIKPHPWELGNPAIQALIDTYSGTLCEFNSYAVLSSDSDVKVLTCSSSIGPEAQAFGKPVCIFAPAVQQWAYSGRESVRYGRDPLLWAAILNSTNGSLGFEANISATSASPWRANDLREELGAFGLDDAVWKN